MGNNVNGRIFANTLASGNRMNQILDIMNPLLYLIYATHEST